MLVACTSFTSPLQVTHSWGNYSVTELYTFAPYKHITDYLDWVFYVKVHCFTSNGELFGKQSNVHGLDAMLVYKVAYLFFV